MSPSTTPSLTGDQAVNQGDRRVLRTDLIHLINSGQAWAFIGSGVSSEAGLPGWDQLVAEVVKLLDPPAKDTVLNIPDFDRAHAKKDWPRCFTVIESAIGRASLEILVRQALAKHQAKPGRSMQLIADWPFAGYVTTNYDGLVETALRPLVPGWPAIGNSADEIRKVSGGASGLVWHVHGSVDLPEAASRLILTSKDYDDHYLENSPLSTQLRAFLQHHRVAFLGFSFRDLELIRLLKLTQRYCSPARPAFAFMRGGDHVDGRRLLEEYNVDVIPYPEADRSHAGLLPVLETHGSLVIRRSLKFGQPGRPVPSYDPETTGLMVFNALVLRGGAKIQKDVAGLLLRARVLALLKYQGPTTDAALIQDLEEKARLVTGAQMKSAKDAASTAVLSCLKALMNEGLIIAHATEGSGRVLKLSPTGRILVEDQSAKAELNARKFSTSLLDRALVMLPENEPGATRVAAAAEAFLKDCIERRALGVAMALASTGDFKSFHMVALLQALPQFMDRVDDEGEARYLVQVIEEVLAERDRPENPYLGLALQARFGIHLLGFDPDALRARLENLANTLFLIDSSTLIHYMARSSIGSDAARLLVRRLQELKAPMATTDWLAVEVAEHARWAKQHVGAAGGPNADTVLAATGRTGYRPNEFLSGFVVEIQQGKAPDLGAYLERAVGPGGASASDEVFRAAIDRAGIPCKPLAEWDGFGDELWAEAEDLEQQIAERRKRSDTYRHERQVKAEAEALVIVRSVRDGTFKYNGKRLTGAFFVSPMRGIGDMAKAGASTMRPDAVLQWLNTLVPCAPDELGTLIDGLVAELNDRGLAIVDRNHLKVAFSPLAEGSKERFQEELTTHHDLISQRWGTEALEAFAEMDGIDAIVAEKPYYAQKAKELQAELEREREARETAQATARLDTRERETLERLKANEKQRELKKRRRQRSAKNRRK